jgi:hypothetical protein
MHVFKITPNLLIRGQFDKRPDKLQELEDLGVTSVITMLRKRDPDLDNLDWLEYYQFPLPDTDTVKVESLYHAAMCASKDILGGGTVLIHCISAADRSPAAAALTLTILEGISGSEAIQRVRAVKPNTLKNRAFVNWLLQFKAYSE